jgi:hypothetical protein
MSKPFTQNATTKAFILPEGIEIQHDIMGDIRREFIRLDTKIREDAVRAWLISQGWTPPKEQANEKSPAVVYREFDKHCGEIISSALAAPKEQGK